MATITPPTINSTRYRTKRISNLTNTTPAIPVYHHTLYIQNNLTPGKVMTKKRRGKVANVNRKARLSFCGAPPATCQRRICGCFYLVRTIRRIYCIGKRLIVAPPSLHKSRSWYEWSLFNQLTGGWLKVAECGRLRGCANRGQYPLGWKRLPYVALCFNIMPDVENFIMLY